MDNSEEAQVRIILLDIEGTTTPMAFVYETLFPYARRKLDAFLFERARDPEIQKLVDDLRLLYKLDARSGLKPPAWTGETGDERLHSCAAYAQWLIARDSKHEPLKALEGKIWQEGYANKELRGEVFPDVPAAFARWKRQKKTICIYSSGSVLSQQLLFRTTASGDLSTFISMYFDMQIGPKTEAKSYKKIARSFDCEAEQILFITDAKQEIEAAWGAEMQAMLCVRDPAAAPPEKAYRVIQNFGSVFPV